MSIMEEPGRLPEKSTKGDGVRYLLLLYGDAEAEAALTTDERLTIVHAHRSLGSELRASGVLVEAEALAAPVATVRMGDGHATVTDGPFAETKEQLGSFLLECESVNEAIACAKRIPESPGLAVEVVPIDL
jgi:hypothetical protein